MDAQDDSNPQEQPAPAAKKGPGRPPKAVAASIAASPAESPQQAASASPPLSRAIKALRRLHIDPVDVVGHPLGQEAMSIKLNPGDIQRNVRAAVADGLIKSGAASAV